MGRTHRTKTTVKENQYFTITDLTKKYNVLKEGVQSNHSMSWSCGSRATGSIGYEINTLDFYKPHIRLKYSNTNNFTKEVTKMDYKIDLVRVKSNLPNNNGFRWYFKCPITGKLCTLLISTGKYFRSRDSKNVYYESQIQTKTRKDLILSSIFNFDEIMDTRQKFENGQFRIKYKDQHTKRYLQFLKRESKVFASAQSKLRHLQKFISKFSSFDLD